MSNPATSSLLGKNFEKERNSSALFAREIIQQSFPTSPPRLQVNASSFPLPLFQMVNGVLVDVENLRDCFCVVRRFVTLYNSFRASLCSISIISYAYYTSAVKE